MGAHSAFEATLRDEYLSASQAKALGVHMTTLTRAVERGEVQAICLPAGRLYRRIDVELLIAFLNALRPNRRRSGRHAHARSPQKHERPGTEGPGRQQ